jgi:outer membrane protein assembly factor BamA
VTPATSSSAPAASSAPGSAPDAGLVIVDPAASGTAAPLPPPEGMEHRARLTDEDYAKKKELGYFTGLPIANADPNSGIGAGARVYYFFNGTRADPRFAYTPYLHRVFLQGFASTGGLQFHWLDYDAPNLLGTTYRVRAAAIVARNTANNYYGRGERAMKPLSFSGAPGQSFARAADYEARLSAVGPDGRTFALYDKYDYLRPAALMSIEKLLFGGRLRPFVGFGFSYARITEYSGKQTDAIDPISGGHVQAPQASTRLGEDCALGLIVGCGGGWDNTLRLALNYDTRDFEPDPNSGVYAEVSTEIGSKVLGSSFDYIRTLGALRVYVSPFPRLADLVIAGRVVYQVQSAGMPFFSMDILPFSEDSRFGLGGVRTLRGYKQDRFVGPVMALTNLELRWSFYEVVTAGQRFLLILVPFVDVGRVFDDVKSTRLTDWRRGQGAGLRVAWNQATVIFVDYGFSREDTGLYINFNHIF